MDIHRIICRTGDVLGSVAGHCHVVKSGGSGNIAACTKHYDFADGSSMTGHATETINGNAVIKARHVIAGTSRACLGAEYSTCGSSVLLQHRMFLIGPSHMKARG